MFMKKKIIIKKKYFIIGNIQQKLFYRLKKKNFSDKHIFRIKNIKKTILKKFKKNYEKVKIKNFIKKNLQQKKKEKGFHRTEKNSLKNIFFDEKL